MQHRSISLLRDVLALAVLVTMLLATTPAASSDASSPDATASGGIRQSGVQITPDGRQTLISKDVGGERWAIVYDEESGGVTGNVFTADGAPPRFVACTRVGSNPSSALITFACSGADACPAAPCSPQQWTALGEVSLPATFFWPPFAGD